MSVAAPARRVWTLEGGLDGLPGLAGAVRALAAPVLGEEGAGDVELALVEAVTNVIRHGYGPEGGPVTVEADVGAAELALRVVDWGRPIPGEALAGAGPERFDFDPEDVAALPEGGLGLALIAALVDAVGYRTDGGRNLLSLVRRPRPAAVTS